MIDIEKLVKSINTLKPNTEFTFRANEVNEETYNTIEWNTGVDNGTAITTTTNPHSELTWILVNAEMDAVQSKYDAQDYARKRKAEYPKIEDLVVALYDTDDKVAIDAKRAEIKLKYPKPGA